MGGGQTNVVIGVIGDSSDLGNEAGLAVAEAVGLSIARAGAVLITGGRSGVMEAASRGARMGGGLVVGVLSSADRRDANPHVGLAIPTGLGRGRGLAIINSSDAIVMIGGGAGTLVELGLAYLAAKKIVLIRGSGGWSDRAAAVLLEGRYLDERRIVPIDFADTAEAAVALCVCPEAQSRP